MMYMAFLANSWHLRLAHREKYIIKKTRLKDYISQEEFITYIRKDSFSKDYFVGRVETIFLLLVYL